MVSGASPKIMDIFSSKAIFHLLILIELFLAPTRAQTAYQEIFTLEAFSLQQTCAQYCFTNSLSGCTTDMVADAIGCSYNSCKSPFQAVDDCYCRADLQSAAESFLASCIKEFCTVGDTSYNVAVASSIYAGYCTSKGFTAKSPAQNTAGTTSGGTSGNSLTTTGRTGSTTTAAVTLFEDVVYNTLTTTNRNLTTALYAVGAVCGVSSFVAILSTVCFCKQRRRARYQQTRPNIPYNYGQSEIGESSSTRHLNSQIGSRLSDDARTIFPNESASVLGQPVNLPQYPVAPPSLVSTNMPQDSRLGTRRNYSQY